MKPILPYPLHTDITLLDIMSTYENKIQVLYIVYKDPDQIKRVERIESPLMEIYFVKPEYRKKFLTSREYLSTDKLYSKLVPANRVLEAIYEESAKIPDPIGDRLRQVYDRSREIPSARSSMKEILKWPYTLFSDMSVEDYYWIQLGYQYNTLHGHSYDICYADIENDIYRLTSTDQAANMDPVILVTQIFRYDEHGPNKGKLPEVITHMLINPEYKEQKWILKHMNEMYQICHEKFDKQSVIKDGDVRIIDTTATYEIIPYHSEKALLAGVFKTINERKPDLCEFWNMPYDMPKMEARMRINGMTPSHYMCDSEVFQSTNYMKFHIDDRPIDMSDRNSYIRMLSTTQYIDQMQNYAGLRKGMKSFGSTKLDNIAKIELGMGKLTFPSGVNIRNAPYKAYILFFLYNIRDVWCQYLTDYTTNDTMALIYDMNQSFCPIYNLTKQTKYQRYIYYSNYLMKGFVPGNNVNAVYTRSELTKLEQEKFKQWQRIKELLDARDGEFDDDDENAETDEDLLALSILDDIKDPESVYKDSIDRKLPLLGGLVGNPNNNSPNGVELFDNTKSKHIYRFVMDMDYSSEYPWVKFTRSISRSTQIGRLVIPNKISIMQNKLPLGQLKRKEESMQYIPGAEFTSDYISQDYLSFGMVWFNLPSCNEMYKILNSKVLKEVG